MSTDEAVQFFYEHAGYNWQPDTETQEEGRMRCARQMAQAEEWAKEYGYTVEWSDDWWIDREGHQREFDCYDEGGPQTCEVAVLINAGGDDVASLGCIDDATPEYKRVIEAELALEVMPEPEYEVR